MLTACNQKTNRAPVVDYDEDQVAEAIEGLRDKQLVLRVDGAGSRVQKYRHRIEERLGLTAASQALLTVLLLRDRKPLEKLRTRTERMQPFATLKRLRLNSARLLKTVSYRCGSACRRRPDRRRPASRTCSPARMPSHKPV